MFSEREGIASQIPEELHPDDERIVAIVPIWNAQKVQGSYSEAMIVTRGFDGRFWVGRFVYGKHVEGSSHVETTIRKATARALSMGAW